MMYQELLEALLVSTMLIQFKYDNGKRILQERMRMLNHQKFFIFQARARQKNTLHNGKYCVDPEHYGAICLMFDTLRVPGCIVSVMMLTVEFKRRTGAPVSLHILSKHVAYWLVSVGIVQHCVTHVAQNTWHCEITMQDITNNINS